jgi:hypothetical protein
VKIRAGKELRFEGKDDAVVFDVREVKRGYGIEIITYPGNAYVTVMKGRRSIPLRILSLPSYGLYKEWAEENPKVLEHFEVIFPEKKGSLVYAKWALEARVEELEKENRYLKDRLIRWEKEREGWKEQAKPEVNNGKL